MKLRWLLIYIVFCISIMVLVYGFGVEVMELDKQRAMFYGGIAGLVWLFCAIWTKEDEKEVDE